MTFIPWDEYHTRKRDRVEIVAKSDVSKIYSKEYFEELIHYEQKTASVFARIILEHVKPKSLIDIGSGVGIYLKAFYDLGINDCIGYDGSAHAVSDALLPGRIMLHDLRRPLRLKRRYDLCLCIEVAEHLDGRYAPLLINTLVSLSNRICFTAAIPGQGGLHHVNEKPHEYWIDLFGRKGFTLRKGLTNQIRREMTEAEVVWWIPQNLMIFEKERYVK